MTTMKAKRALEIVEIVRTCDVGPITVPSGTGDDFRFRVEIVRIQDRKPRYRARVWRIEHYRIQPTFPQKRGRPSEEPCDELLLVRDHHLAEGITGATKEATLRKALERIEKRFGIS